MIKRLLWIEDELESVVVHHFSAVQMSGRFRIDPAATASAACDLLRTKTYDIVVVDVRIDPGLDPAWERIYTENGRQKDRARLGLHVLRALILRQPGLPDVVLPAGSECNPSTIGVFTVERHAELAPDLSKMGITHYLNKTLTLGTEAVVKFVDGIGAVASQAQ